MIAALAIAVFCALVLFVSFRIAGKQRAHLIGDLAAAMGASPVRPVSVLGYTRHVPGFDVEVEGRKVTIGVAQGARGADLLVQVHGNALPRILFRRERLLDRVGRVARLNRETQSGDATFDREVYLESDEAASAVRRVVEQAPAREATLRAVRSGRSVLTSREGVGARVPIAKRATPVALGATLRALSSQLAGVADAIAPTPDGVGVRRRARGDLLAVAAVGFGILVFVLVLGLPWLKPDSWAPYLHADAKVAERIGGRVALALLVACFFWVRGHSRSLRNFAVLAVVGVLAVPSAVARALWIVNAVRDVSPPEQHRVEVVSKARRYTQQYTFNELRIESWTQPGQVDTVDVDYGVWRTVQPRQAIDVTARAGALGWMWIVAVQKPAASS